MFKWIASIACVVTLAACNSISPTDMPIDAGSTPNDSLTGAGGHIGAPAHFAGSTHSKGML